MPRRHSAMLLRSSEPRNLDGATTREVKPEAADADMPGMTALAIAPESRRKRNWLRMTVLGAACAAGIAVGGVLSLHPWLWWTGIPVTALIIGLTLGSRYVLPSTDRDVHGRDRRIAARTARALASLPRMGFDVIHNLPLPGPRGSVEHVVIGPTGIYALACGDGDEVAWRAAQAALEVRRRLRALRLGLPVVGLAVGRKVGEARVPGVSRLRPRDLLTYVGTAGRRLSDLQIERALAAILDRHPSGQRPATV
jgi:hypothetical protein